MSDSTADKIKKVGVQVEAPWINVSYRYDIWGDPMRTNAYSTSLPYRILSPVKVKDTKDIFPASLALMQWNDNPDNEPYYPELPARSIKYNGKEITNEQYSEYVREAGKIAKGYVKDAKFSDPPTAEEINFIKKALEAGRKEAKYNLMERLSKRNGK